MQIRTEFPHPVRLIENSWIPLADGIRLAARIWLPEGAEAKPVPAILEYLPYRKNDGTVERDEPMHGYFAGHGYACVRVDMRGSGDADGILYDEYLLQEQDDALEVLRWIASQPWCNGKIGMMGISWGGFNGLQVAARRPPELKAIITVCSTDDRYHDDCHYMGGCLLASDMLSWAAIMFALNGRPPDPKHVGERWRAMWFERLEQTPPYIHAWLTHPTRDAFWQHGSVREDYAAIQCPVYAIGGWADAYTNAVPRLLAGLTVPRKGLIGPWAHMYAHNGIPGPAIGYLQEALRWWDYWLKGVDTGIMDEPMLRAWVQESMPPQTYYTTWPGRWVAEASWPSANILPTHYFLSKASLSLQAKEPDTHALRSIHGSQLTGAAAGVWCPYGRLGDLPSDQREDDGLSLCFDGDALDEPMEVLGFPAATLRLTVDQPLALVAVRLCDVAPTGESTLVSWGLLNLTHHQSHEQPHPLTPGEFITVTVQLNAVGHRLAANHHWRLAISPTYWPHAWPSPLPVTLTLDPAKSRLTLPLRTPSMLDTTLSPFAPPEAGPAWPVEVLRTGGQRRTVTRDQISGRCERIDYNDNGRRRFADGLVSEFSKQDTFSITEGGS